MVFAFVKNSKAKTKGKYAMEMVWFAKPYIFTIWPPTEKVCRSLI